MKLLTYYQELGEPRQRKVLDLWVKVWEREGWEPFILGYEDAKAHPLFDEFTARVMALPTVNSKAFEVACFQRWLAFARVGGVMMDYDVFPRIPFPPREFPNGLTTGGGSISMIAGSKADFERIVTAIMGYEPDSRDITFGKPHVSDMVIIERKANELFQTHLDLAAEYTVPRWDSLPLVHFSNGYMQRKATMDRAEEISLVLKL